jgi:hypothetical protein
MCSCSLNFPNYDLTCHLRAKAAGERAPPRLGQCAHASLTASEKTNLMGSIIGLYIVYHFEIVLYYRRRREYGTRSSFFPLGSNLAAPQQLPRHISRPYRPLSGPTRPPMSILTTRTSPVYNYSRYTTNQLRHRRTISIEPPKEE